MSIDNALASQIVEALRNGIPPQKGVSHYSVGNEKIINGIMRFHFPGMLNHGIIRFVSGSWGSGKTHFFRLLREVALHNNCLVSNVELEKSSAAMNKFQSVFAAIIRMVATPSYYVGDNVPEIAPFGTVISESLYWLAKGTHNSQIEVTYECYQKAVDKLMSDPGIDIDFKKMVKQYWETFLPETPDKTIVEETRGEILQWFCGEGSIGIYRKKYGVSKLVTKDNAKIMLQSLAGFVRMSGYNGLLILFDEAEQAYSIMRQSALREAHNNLLSLINNIEALPGLFLIYATTPDFYSDPKFGIIIYGALSGRIGKPDENRYPRALDTIWNFDAVQTDLEDYQKAAVKIKAIYSMAFPGMDELLPNDSHVEKRVRELYQQHSHLAGIRFWRLLVSSMIADFDDHLEGEVRSSEILYDDIMEQLRNE
ncbi:MAG: BREX system ATP-binding domain-containing protein [Candidatus Cloacimonadaceae bacterium]|jgi:hypothetical protein|nr:ATP-binding protein [Candidatus Cloacimonadota bacterium]MDX9949011.1 DUF2791 family P-loop domain-containing protein [Candidatus Syntrophosphaera sp.]